jgi:hypothetical protein
MPATFPTGAGESYLRSFALQPHAPADWEMNPLIIKHLEAAIPHFLLAVICT